MGLRHRSILHGALLKAHFRKNNFCKESFWKRSNLANVHFHEFLSFKTQFGKDPFHKAHFCKDQFSRLNYAIYKYISINLSTYLSINLYIRLPFLGYQLMIKEPEDCKTLLSSDGKHPIEPGFDFFVNYRNYK